MTPLLAAIEAEQIVIVAIPILSVLAVLMTVVLTHHFRRLQRDDMEATLKMEMIQRGMSAEDIERVLAARINSPSRHRMRGKRGYAPRGATHPEA